MTEHLILSCTGHKKTAEAFMYDLLNEAQKEDTVTIEPVDKQHCQFCFGIWKV